MGKKKVSPSGSSRAKSGDLSEKIASAYSTPRNDQGFFPKIYRFITESWKLLLSSFISGLLLFFIAYQMAGLYQNKQEEQKLSQERGKVEKELSFWKKSLEKYPDHRDIYFRLASLEYRLGNTDAAAENLQKTLKIDPNFEKGREMEKLIEQ